MDKFEQIAKLAEAAALVQEVANVCHPEFKVSFKLMIARIGDLADQLEEVK